VYAWINLERMNMRHVLLVEDVPDIARVVSLSLDPARYHLTWAETLAGARATLRGGRLPDAVVLDIGLPDGDGLSLCRELKGRAPEVPVIVVTADGVPRSAAIAAGADRFLPKPFDPDELGRAIDALAAPGMRRRPRPTQPPRAPAPGGAR
jgi:DNA-binding response OmpR family regulator